MPNSTPAIFSCSTPPTYPCLLWTEQVNVIEGSVRGIPMRFIDTPGLHPTASKLASNQRALNSINAAFKKYKPDIVRVHYAQTESHLALCEWLFSSASMPVCCVPGVVL